MKSIFLGLALASLSAVAAFAQDADVENGEAKFKLWCVACHGAGPGHPGTQALEKLYGTDDPDMPAEIARRKDLDADMVSFFVRNGTSIMPFVRKTELTDQDIIDIAGFINANANK